MHFASADAAVLAQRIDRPAGGDRRKPGLDRSAGLIGVAYPVDGQQHVLDDVVGQLRGPAAPLRDGAYERADRMEEQAVCIGVAALRSGKKLAPAPLRRNAAALVQIFLRKAACNLKAGPAEIGYGKSFEG